MIFGRHFTLLTDHKPLLSIFGSKKGIPVYSASQLQCWAITLLGYDFEIKYCRTTEFGQADALSCLIRSHSAPDDDTIISAISIKDDFQCTLTDCVRGIPVMKVEIKQEQMLQKLIQFLRYSRPSDLTGELQQFQWWRDSLAIIDECLMFADQVVIPKKLRRASTNQIASRMFEHLPITLNPMVKPNGV